MGRAKEIIVKVIPSKVAVPFVKKVHYSGTVSNTSSLHFGCFLDNKMHGVMSFGSPMVKSKVIGLVQPSKWNEMLELNRMAFDEYLPKYSESRCIAIAIKLIKKNATHIKWILSYSDGSQCGDGVIYRATGFKLTNIKKNTAIGMLPDGEKVNRLSLTTKNGNNSEIHNLIKKYNVDLNKGSLARWYEVGLKWIKGFQLKYIYLIDKSCKITVPILPFSKIDEMGAGMYKGEKITVAERK